MQRGGDMLSSPGCCLPAIPPRPQCAFPANHLSQVGISTGMEQVRGDWCCCCGCQLIFSSIVFFILHFCILVGNVPLWIHPATHHPSLPSPQSKHRGVHHGILPFGAHTGLALCLSENRGRLPLKCAS